MFTLNCKGRMLVIDQPITMGIINTTPDSFFEESRVNTIDDILFRVENMLREGASIIDVGGQSTRPGSELLGPDEEAARVIPAIEAISRRFPDRVISVDTFYSRVAKEAAHAGASIINDVSAGTMDPDLLTTVGRLGIPYVLMHMKGTPRHMQQHAEYNNVTLEVFDFLNFKLNELKTSGLNDIIIDPGFGFAKTTKHNFQLLRELSFFQELSSPVMVGLSRKATVYKTLGIPPQEALNGTTVLHTIALMQGASILRVHDVKEAMQAIRLFQEYKK